MVERLVDLKIFSGNVRQRIRLGFAEPLKITCVPLTFNLHFILVMLHSFPVYLPKPPKQFLISQSPNLPFSWVCGVIYCAKQILTIGIRAWSPCFGFSSLTT